MITLTHIYNSDVILKTKIKIKDNDLKFYRGHDKR